MALFVYPRTSAFGLNIKPAEGSRLLFYEAGTTTPKTVYSDPEFTTPHTQPVLAVANGVFPAVYLSGTYKVVLQDPDGSNPKTDDNQIARAGAVEIKGDFDSTTNGSNYPASGSLGDTYRVTATFTLAAASGGHQLVDGDFIIANKNGATAIDADWDIIRGVYPNRAIEALTAGATINTNCNLGTAFTVTLDQNSTLANPTNKLVGYTYIWIVTNGSTTAYTLAFGTDFNFEGNNEINRTAGSVTIIKGVVVSSTSIQCEIQGQRALDYDAKNMDIGVVAADSLPIKADSIQYTNSNGETREEYNINDSWVPSTDIVGGESGSASQELKGWRDSDGNMALSVEEEGTADGTTAGFLDASGNTLFKRGAVKGDTLRNTTDNTNTTIKTTPTVDGQDVEVVDDIFVSGDTYKLIKTIPPTTLGEFANALALGYQDATPDLVKSQKIGKAQITDSFWHTANGYGSTNTKIPKFTTEVIASNNKVVTVVNSATDGFSITANMHCKLFVKLFADLGPNFYSGISKNSTELTTSIQAITNISDRIAVNRQSLGNGEISVFLRLEPSDIVRPHTDGTTLEGGSLKSIILVHAEEII